MATKREIVICTIAALATLLAVCFFFGIMEKEKTFVQTDLYTLIAPDADAILAVNRPSAFTKAILSKPAVYNAFASKIPKVYLSILQESGFSSMLLSFHPQGIILYAKASNDQVDQQVIERQFSSFSPQKQKKDKVTFTYYSDRENRFFGCYYYNGIWVASYSKKLLEEVANLQTTGIHHLSSEQNRIRQTFDTNAPLNIMLQTNLLNIYVQVDSVEWKPENQWIGADLFTSEGNICYFGSLPYQNTADTLYNGLSDTLSLRLESLFPQIQISHQINKEGKNVFFTGCCK